MPRIVLVVPAQVQNALALVKGPAHELSRHKTDLVAVGVSSHPQNGPFNTAFDGAVRQNDEDKIALEE